jgi:hypothetical protein
MANKNHTPTARVSPRGNGRQSPKGSQIKMNGNAGKASPPDTGAPLDRTKPPANLTHKEIAARAYLRYQNRPPADEDHLEDWFQAEAELAAERHQA